MNLMRMSLVLLVLSAAAMAVDVRTTYSDAVSSLYAGNLPVAKVGFETVASAANAYPELAETAAFMASFIGAMTPCTEPVFEGWKCVGQVAQELATTQVYFDQNLNSIHFTKFDGLIDLEAMKSRLEERGMILAAETILGHSGYSSSFITTDVGTTQKVSIWSDGQNSFIAYETALAAEKTAVHQQVVAAEKPSAGKSVAVPLSFGLILAVVAVAGVAVFFILKKREFKEWNGPVGI